MNNRFKNWTSINLDRNDDLQDLKMEDFPFKSSLSLEPLIGYWRNELKNKDNYKRKFAEYILSEFEKHPELHGLIEDPKVLDQNKELVEAIVSANYPPDPCGNEIISTNIPFSFASIYSTHKFKELSPVLNSGNNSIIKVDADKAFLGKILNAYSIIFKEFYDYDIQFDVPFIFAIENPQSKIYSYYKAAFNSKYLKVNLIGDKIDLSRDEIKNLVSDVTNIDKWMSVLPPEKFEFYGTVTWTAIDVTENEVISQLKHDLLEKESIISPDRFGMLQKRMRSLFKLPDLQLGLIAIPAEEEQFVEYGRKIGNSFILSGNCELSCEMFERSIYNRAVELKTPVVVEDLKKCEFQSGIENEIMKQGIRNLIIAPLHYEDELIGLLELGSPNLNDLNSMNALKLREILSLFSMAVKRSLEEFENQIQAVIKEECTAIHPSVEWRFRKAAVNLIDNRETESAPEMESIVFDNVFPLYGLSDIRNSSIVRNETIQSDLSEHLRMTRKILSSAVQIKSLPILEQLIYRIDGKISRINTGLGSGDEISILEFVKNEVEPVFELVKDLDSEISEMIEKYFDQLDGELHAVYNRRRDFENSVSQINEALTNYLEHAEENSQKMFPHYFEKYKTDGIEHSIYIGQSLAPNKKFDEIYLKNLRLWQLMTVCGLAIEADKIKPKLTIPLDVTHLILIQNSALSIRFRMDEKKFDVDGTYNIRYEIMKKRIDKAIIKGSSERLTQPGKIAIVYSQRKEYEEYLKYIDFLKMKGYLINEVEELELESLQGVNGLHAIRVEVNLNGTSEKPLLGEEIKKAVKDLATQPN